MLNKHYRPFIFIDKMINRPQLVKTQATLNTGHAHSESDISKQANNTGNAKFIMGLNNRLVKESQRLDKLEVHVQHLLHNRIGYKELGLTLALSLLIFTSLHLVLINPQLATTLKLSALTTNSKEDTISKANSKPASLETSTLPTNLSALTKQNYKWPLESSVKDLNYTHFKKGINVAANLGDSVVAIESGTVLFSGNDVADYGNLVLIQHPNDVISVYGNNYSNYVKKGQKIKKGELIAAVGETSGNLPRLYFEIRHKGKNQDPFLYFQK